MHLRRTIPAIAAAIVLAAPGVAAAHDVPDTIDLPPGFAGEGVAVDGRTFYAGSLAGGFVARGDLRQGTSEVFVSEPLTPASVGLKADPRHDLLWVAGGPSGQAAVYSLDDGSPVVAIPLATGAFINDVTVTRRAAYFTNSFAAAIYEVPVSKRGDIGAARTIALSGPAADIVPGAFNLNGIAATRDGRTLVAVNSTKGELYTIDPATGASALIDLGGVSVASGDGILLEERTLYVLQNGGGAATNQIVVIELDRSLGTGRVVDTITSPLFETATTLATSGDLIVAVNAQFGGAPIDPESELVLIDRNRHDDRDDRD